MKKLLTSTFAGMLLLIILASCSGGNTEEKESTVTTVLPDTSNDVRVKMLKSSNFEHELISNGTIASVHKVDLSFESSEIVDKIYAHNGQQVSKGQKIARLNQFKLQNELEQATDNLEKAKLELQDVLISQGYVLRDSSNIPEDIMKIAKTKSNYNSCIIQYDLAKYNMKKSILYAPINGQIANLFSKEHNPLSSSEPFCSIIGTGNLEADFMVLESELSLINVGDKVQVSPFSYSNYNVSGTVSEINPIVDENGMVRVKASIKNANSKLYYGMNIKVRVQRSIENQLVIPKSALVLRSNKEVVFTVKNNEAVWNYVKIGLENSEGYIITEGLTEGDSVIYDGNLNLAHEAPVNIL